MGVLSTIALTLAAAGGGSSGFGGGGGGGGFSGGGGGGGFGGGGFYVGGGGGGGSIIGFFVVFALIFGFVAFIWIYAAVTIARVRRQRQRRDAQVRLASAEAAQDDEAFAHERVIGDAAALFTAIQSAWDGRDVAALERMVGPDLLVEWRLRLADFQRRGWHNRVRIVSGPTIHYVGLVNRPSDEEDRAVVHVDASLEDYVEAGGMRIMRTGDNDALTRLSEYWTLGKRDGRWILLSIEQDAEGRHHLTSEIVASPWDDTRLADEALVEGAVAQADLATSATGFTAADVVDVDLAGDARAQAMDLALVDGRFAPDVLAAAARRAADAWAEAVDGADAPLEAVATREAVDALLYAGDPTHRTRLVVRGPRVEGVLIERLDAESEPARMTLAVQVRGRRYVEDRDTAAVLSGSQSGETRFTERWTLALDGADATPWRLVGVAGVPA